MGSNKKVKHKEISLSKKAVTASSVDYLSHSAGWHFFKAREESELYIEYYSIHSNLTEIITSIMNFENMNWYDIQAAGSHFISVDDLTSKEAKEKLLHSGYDTVFSLRLTGKKRVFGILDKGVLDILWYDPNHEICKSIKKHT